MAVENSNSALNSNQMTIGHRAQQSRAEQRSATINIQLNYMGWNQNRARTQVITIKQLFCEKESESRCCAVCWFSIPPKREIRWQWNGCIFIRLTHTDETEEKKLNETKLEENGLVVCFFTLDVIAFVCLFVCWAIMFSSLLFYYSVVLLLIEWDSHVNSFYWIV